MSSRTFIAQNERAEGYTHVLLITTGSVASVKAPLIVNALLQVSLAIYAYLDLNIFANLASMNM
jgi:hypothetical protein